MAEDTKLRDHLALERTLLANERTLLAYVRTGLTIVAGGFAIAHFVDGRVAIGTGLLLMIAGATAMSAGVWRFRSVLRRLRGSAPDPR
jgi:putative membrane protein